MKILDIILLIVGILIVACILFLIKTIYNPDILHTLSLLGIFENSNEGIKSILTTILVLAILELLVISLLLVRFLTRLFKKSQ